MRNYLARLGWSHGDDEIFSTEQAIEWFGLDTVGRSPARFDFAKLESLNGHYIRHADDTRLAEDMLSLMHRLEGWEVDEAFREKVAQVMPAAKERAKTLLELADAASFLRVTRPLSLDAKASKLLDDGARSLLGKLHGRLSANDVWETASVEATVRSFAEEEELKLGKVAQPLRAAVTGTTVSPPIFDVLATLGREEALGRIKDQAA
jgi:glutamyl-tRNA synthetase